MLHYALLVNYLDIKIYNVLIRESTFEWQSGLFFKK